MAALGKTFENPRDLLRPACGVVDILLHEVE
jgi:hypothetical protein